MIKKKIISCQAPVNVKLTQLFNFVRSLISRQGDIIHLPATFPVAQKKTPRSAWTLGSRQAWRLPRDGQPVVGGPDSHAQGLVGHFLFLKRTRHRNY